MVVKCEEYKREEGEGQLKENFMNYEPLTVTFLLCFLRLADCCHVHPLYRATATPEHDIARGQDQSYLRDEEKTVYSELYKFVIWFVLLY